MSHAFFKTDSSPPVSAQGLNGRLSPMTNNSSLARSKTASGELETKAFPLSPKLQERLQEGQEQKRKSLCIKLHS